MDSVQELEQKVWLIGPVLGALAEATSRNKWHH